MSEEQLGLMANLSGMDMLKQLEIVERPTSMPNLEPDEYVICVYQDIDGDKVCICFALDQIQRYFDWSEERWGKCAFFTGKRPKQLFCTA